MGLHWSEISPSDILTVDVDGAVIEGRYSVEPTAFFIHARIHRARPDARCVLHTHQSYATSIALLEDGRLKPISQNALRFYGKIAYDPEYNGLALDEAEGDPIVRRLGQATLMFMAHHGVLVCAPSIAWALEDLYYLERAALVQVLAQSTGKALKRVPHEQALKTARECEGSRGQADLLLAAAKQALDRESPGWAAL